MTDVVQALEDLLADVEVFMNVYPDHRWSLEDSAIRAHDALRDYHNAVKRIRSLRRTNK